MKTVYKKQQGFTLIEIMVVVVILGILAAIIVPKVMDRPEQAKLVKAKQDILAISEALDLYKLDNGEYPSTDQGLQALIQQPSGDPSASNWRKGGYLKSLPSDPWQHAYQYLNPGQHGEIDIFSYGKQGPNSDSQSASIIGNWTKHAGSNP